MSKDQDDPSSEHCRFVGGNDYVACMDCGVEYDYRRYPKPPCGAIARAEQLMKQKQSIEMQLFRLQPAIARQR